MAGMQIIFLLDTVNRRTDVHVVAENQPLDELVDQAQEMGLYDLGKLPKITEAEALEVLTDERPLAVSFFSTDQGREHLRRLYFSCAHTNKELAEICRTTPEVIGAFVGKQGWPAEREQSRRDGEIAARRAAMRVRADEIKMQALEVAAKGIDVMAGEDFDGVMVLASAKSFRSLTQSISDLVPAEEAKGAINNSIINIGSQVVIAEE